VVRGFARRQLATKGLQSMKPALLLALFLLPGASCLADTQLDGRYVGQRTVVRGSKPTCPSDGAAFWRITNGQFAYRFWAGRVPVQISADGTLKGEMLYSPSHGRNSWVRVTGTISGGSLEADAEWRACQLHYSLTRM
jgi:hypothetical protein